MVGQAAGPIAQMGGVTLLTRPGGRVPVILSPTRPPAPFPLPSGTFTALVPPQAVGGTSAAQVGHRRGSARSRIRQDLPRTSTPQRERLIEEGNGCQRSRYRRALLLATVAAEDDLEAVKERRLPQGHSAPSLEGE